MTLVNGYLFAPKLVMAPPASLRSPTTYTINREVRLALPRSKFNDAPTEKMKDRVRLQIRHLEADKIDTLIDQDVNALYRLLVLIMFQDLDRYYTNFGCSPIDIARASRAKHLAFGEPLTAFEHDVIRLVNDDIEAKEAGDVVRA